MKRKRRHRAQTRTYERDWLALEIRGELRRIIRKWSDLASPLCLFRELSDRPASRPRYPVCLSLSGQMRTGTGLRMGVKQLVRPDERLDDFVYGLAGSLWHLKDRLRQWCAAAGRPDRVEEHANGSADLLICADLVNRKKHGCNDNRSGLDPWVDQPVLDTSQSGVVEFLYDGAWNETILIVSEPKPIPYRVDILRDAGKRSERTASQGREPLRIGSSSEIFLRALAHWCPLIDELEALRDDPESAALRRALSQIYPAFVKEGCPGDP
jgi:hypothetical protein